MRFRSVLCLVGSLSVAGLPAGPAEATTYDLYYLGGQSNMEGYGRVEELPEELRGPVDGVKPSPTRWHRWSDMDEANGLVREWAELQGDVTYVDTATPLLGDDGTPREALYDDDGLHLSEDGYAVWNAALGPHLAVLCPQTPAE